MQSADAARAPSEHIEGAGVSDDFKALIGKVATGASLSRDEATKAFDLMMSGAATPSPVQPKPAK